jgi:deoxyribodipyrimidine photo-lyase
MVNNEAESSTAGPEQPRGTLIYILRRDLRLEDNPIFDTVSQLKRFKHFLPLYVFPAHQVEVSGFIPDGSEEKSPYPEARSIVGKFWRCGPYRAKFLGESVWELKEVLEKLGSGLNLRVGLVPEVVDELIAGLKERGESVEAVWMTNEEGIEENKEQKQVRELCEEKRVEFKEWKDEKYFVDE